MRTYLPIHYFLISISQLFPSITHALRSLEDGLTALPFLPTVIPLAVRSPYLGTYLANGEDKDLSEMSPRFWTGSPIGWTGLVRVDGEVFNWMGNLTEWQAANNTGFALTSSSSNFTYTLANATVQLHVSFLSPLTPRDLFRQSLPLSYLSVTAESLDELPHQVEVYTEINGLWCSDSEDAVIEWEYHLNHSSDWQTMQLRLQDQKPFSEEFDRILHGAVWYSTLRNAQVTRSIGRDAKQTRSLFAKAGRLDNQFNSTFRAIRAREETRDEPVLSFAHIFGAVGHHTPLERRTALISVGHIRDPVVQYMSAGEKLVSLKPFWASQFISAWDMIGFHLQDYDHARAASDAWDTQLQADARRAHGPAYADLLAISTRQIFMALETVWDEDNVGNSNGSDTLLNGTPAMVMLKEISSNGNCQTTDVIAPMLPFFIYGAPELLALLLEPIYRYISTGLYRPLPTPHDLGDHYPNATGRNDFVYSNLPLEESGNFLNLALGCVRLRTCEVQARTYYKILKQWADWLVENALYPDDQRSTDDFFGPSPNQTSLVVKGILGIRAMSEISKSLGKSEDSKHYSEVANRYLGTFLDLAVDESRTHLMGSYGNQSSWSTQYNLFLDHLFDFQMFPDWVYEMQDRWYILKAGPPNSYGPPLDSRAPDRAKTDWLVWAAAASRAEETRARLLGSVTRYVRQTLNNVFGDLISVDGGWSIGFLVRPVVGGHFALLAHAPEIQKISSSRSQQSSTLALLTGLFAILYLSWSRFRAWKRSDRKSYPNTEGLVRGSLVAGSSRAQQRHKRLEEDQDQPHGEDGEGLGIRLLRPPSYQDRPLSPVSYDS